MHFAKNLQKRFVIVSVDKYTNNYAIIFKKFEKIAIELTEDNFYVKMNIDKDPIINFFCLQKQYKSLFSYTFNFSNHYGLPFIFMTSKFHMSAFKFRYTCYTSKSIN